MCETVSYKSWEARSTVIKRFYASMTKSEKSQLLDDLNRNYALRPNTMSTKFSGYNKLKPVEIFVVEHEMKKRSFNFNV